jgi:ribosomal protein L11 methyltransferase
LAVYPALDIRLADAGMVLAAADDFAPRAVEEHPDAVTIFFSNPRDRDLACAALVHRFPRAVITSRDVDDEDWARRSQNALEPVTVGRLTVFPAASAVADRRAADGSAALPAGGQRALPLVIVPSMGFGTGHHPTTRLCLAALQQIDLGGAEVLDVGTGSGILALAARLLGAKGAIGVDSDPDALQSARENLAVNPGVDRVSFAEADLQVSGLPPAQIITANLTGALLAAAAPRLLAALLPGGSLIVSGLLAPERASVVAAFQPVVAVWEREESGWLALVLRPAS